MLAKVPAATTCGYRQVTLEVTKCLVGFYWHENGNSDDVLHRFYTMNTEMGWNQNSLGEIFRIKLSLGYSLLCIRISYYLPLYFNWSTSYGLTVRLTFRAFLTVLECHRTLSAKITYMIYTSIACLWELCGVNSWAKQTAVAAVLDQ